MTYKKSFIKIFVGLMIANFIVMGFSTGMFTGYGSIISIHNLASAVGTCTIICIIAGAVITSRVLKNMKTKQGRIQFLMLPASNKCKFWSKVALCVVGGIVIPRLAVVCADLLQMLISLIFTGGVNSIVANYWQNLPEALNFASTESGYDGLMYLIIGSVTLWSVSSYILGGTVFRKAPFIMTTLCWNVFWIVCILCGGFFIAWLADTFDYVEIDFIWDPKATMVVIFSLVALAFTVFNIWFSYRTFKRMSAINNGFTNL